MKNKKTEKQSCRLKECGNKSILAIPALARVALPGSFNLDRFDKAGSQDIYRDISDLEGIAQNSLSLTERHDEACCDTDHVSIAINADVTQASRAKTGSYSDTMVLVASLK